MAIDRLAVRDLSSKWDASQAETMLGVISFLVLCTEFQICNSNVPVLAVVTLSLQLHVMIFSQTAHSGFVWTVFLRHTT